MRKVFDTQRVWFTVVLALAATMIAAAISAAADPSPGEMSYRSPYDLAFSPNGKRLAISDRTARALVLVDPALNKVVSQTALCGQGSAVAWAGNGESVFVTEYENASVAEIGIVEAKVLRRFPVGPHPVGVAVAARRQLLLVANNALTDVSVIDLASGKEKTRIKTVREPFWIAVTPDESTAIVSNLLPAGSAADPLITAAVSLIDLESQQRVADIKLPPNTTCIRQTAVSPDGRWAYAVHTVGRTTLPATQLDRGWVNTNALSIIDLKARQLYATVLLDNLAEGGADPWGVALSKDGGTMWITLAGIHQIARIDLAGLHEGLAGKLPPALRPGAQKVTPPPGVWAEIKADPAKRADLVNDLTAMYVGGLLTRSPLPGKAPRGIAVAPDSGRLAVAMYYSGAVLLADPSIKTVSAIAMGPQRQTDDVRRGEIIFHDASYSFQHWLSCATCHPNHARADGMNWDLPNDGIGNPKSAKSLLQAHLTGPSMWTGVRDSMETAAAAGFRFAAFQPPPEDVKSIQAYLRSLQPDRSPYRLADGGLSEKARRGKTIFESEQTGCAKCHSGEQYTCFKAFNVGTQGQLDHKDQDTFDTPTLIELWRTAPYFHDGHAATLQEVLTTSNREGRHGKTSHLSKEQIEDLVEFLLSL